MADLKTQKKDDLKKMGKKDRSALIEESNRNLAHVRLRVKSGEDKQSHKIKAYKKQVARLKTFNRAEESNASNNES